MLRAPGLQRQSQRLFSRTDRRTKRRTDRRTHGNTEVRIEVVEKSGVNIVRILSKKNPFNKENCQLDKTGPTI